MPSNQRGLLSLCSAHSSIRGTVHAVHLRPVLQCLFLGAVAHLHARISRQHPRQMLSGLSSYGFGRHACYMDMQNAAGTGGRWTGRLSGRVPFRDRHARCQSRWVKAQGTWICRPSMDVGVDSNTALALRNARDLGPPHRSMCGWTSSSRTYY